MLTGEYNHSLDAKGRLIIPSKFRETLGEKFVITRGLDCCLYLYPSNEWESVQEKLLTLPITNKKAREFTRFLAGGSLSGESVDKQGRVSLPTTLRSYAKLEKDVVLVGVLDRVEIWDKSTWDAYNADVITHVDEIAGQMEELGLRI